MAIACDWNAPGHNPFQGPIVEAVDNYKDIPKEVRTRLKAKMAKREYDDIAVIKRDSIVGKGSAYHGLRDMHFGKGRICKTVNRSKWKEDATEVGLVYCEDTHCIIVPTVCRNVSRVTPLKLPKTAQWLVPPQDQYKFQPWPEYLEKPNPVPNLYRWLVHPEPTPQALPSEERAPLYSVPWVVGGSVVVGVPVFIRTPPQIPPRTRPSPTPVPVAGTLSLTALALLVLRLAKRRN